MSAMISKKFISAFLNSEILFFKPVVIIAFQINQLRNIREKYFVCTRCGKKKTVYEPKKDEWLAKTDEKIPEKLIKLYIFN